MADACQGEAQSIGNAEAEVADLKKTFHAEIEELKDADH